MSAGSRPAPARGPGGGTPATHRPGWTASAPGIRSYRIRSQHPPASLGGAALRHGAALLAGLQPVSATAVLVGVSAQHAMRGRVSLRRPGLRLARPRLRLGVLGVAHAKAAIGPGEHVVLAVSPGPVFHAGHGLVSAEGVSHLPQVAPARSA